MTSVLEYLSTYLHSNPLDEQCSIQVNVICAFRATWKISFWQRFQMKKITFQKLLFGIFVGRSKLKQRKLPKVWGSYSCYKRLIRWNVAVSACSWCKPHARCISNATCLQKCETNLFSSLQRSLQSLCFSLPARYAQIPLATVIIAWRIHQSWHGKNICMIFSHSLPLFPCLTYSLLFPNESKKSFSCVLPLWSLVGGHKLSDYCCYAAPSREGLSQIWNPGKVKQRKMWHLYISWKCMLTFHMTCQTPAVLYRNKF